MVKHYSLTDPKFTDPDSDERPIDIPVDEYRKREDIYEKYRLFVD
jgi:hypothetical protein